MRLSLVAARCGSSRRRRGARACSSSPSAATRTSASGSGRPTVPMRCSLGRVERRGGARLGQPVALEHEHAAGVEELDDLGADRRGAGDRKVQVLAEDAADLRQHEAVGEVVAPARERARRGLPARRAAARRPSASAQAKTARLSRRCSSHVGQDGGVDLLEDARDRGEVRRARLGQLGDDLLGVAAPVDDVPPTASTTICVTRASTWASGRKRIGDHAAVQLQPVPAAVDRGQHVGVREHAALRRPGRARRVDDRGHVVGPHGRGARGGDRLVQRAPALAQGVQGHRAGAEPVGRCGARGRGSYAPTLSILASCAASSQKTTREPSARARTGTPRAEFVL